MYCMYFYAVYIIYANLIKLMEKSHGSGRYFHNLNSDFSYLWTKPWHYFALFLVEA